MVPLAEAFGMPPSVARKLLVDEFRVFCSVIDRRVAEHQARRGRPEEEG